MFSNHVRKIDQAPHKTLLLLAAGLVIVCQLVAMALVAGEQVQKAQMRSESHASQQAVVASCVEVSRGVAINDCFSLGSSEREARRSSNHEESSAPNGAMTLSGELETTATPVVSQGATSGFIPASFTARW